MPIRIPDSLPATATLESENIFVMTEYRALHQDIRPLKLVILNLMPTKITTETQILRKLSNTPLQIDVELLQTANSASGSKYYELINSQQDYIEVRSQNWLPSYSVIDLTKDDFKITTYQITDEGKVENIDNTFTIHKTVSR